MPNGWSDFQPVWPGSLQPVDFSGEEILRISAAPVNAEELQNLIQNSGGAIIVERDHSNIALARKDWNWFWFNTQLLTDGRVKITETNYLMYGGIGLSVLFLAIAMRGR